MLLLSYSGSRQKSRLNLFNFFTMLPPSEKNKKLRAVIIDDEERSRNILGQLIERYCPDIEVVAMANDVLGGVKIIDQHQPDVVFLDIEMPNYSGFKLVEHFDQQNFKLIFTTAYEEYALKAFKVSAVGYLLKPIDIDELIRVVDKLLAQVRKEREQQQQGTTRTTIPSSPRLILPTHNGLIYANLEEICFFESQGRYTRVVLVDGSEMVTTRSLKEYQKILHGTTFLRVHRSFIINLMHLSKYSRGRDCFVVLDNGRRIDVGKNFKENLSEAVSFFLR